ncbi:immunoglobulin superfamily member 3 [Misgurnus anguillicaudatus]|uniref:immunoglobulin superfamily member 3 n=1 Tax=Misgurnus anguillicaudatus TaxID=75329 RepID=UPI003CCF5494
MINCLYLKMFLFNCLLLSVLLMVADGFTVKGSSGPLVVPLGGSVVLHCSVERPLSLEDLEVEWRRSDSQTLIHLYQAGEIRPESQHQDYHDRAHFFTEDIKHGNFSLLLNNLTAEDEGQYTCKVYTGQESGETVVEIKHVERLIVSGSSQSISASVGGDVTLNCSVNSHIKPEEIEEVSWKKTNKGEPILVLLYQYNETLSDASDERYRDRVEFFTDEIHRGNFSLRLKRVRTEDKGVYICQVFNGELSANTTVKLEQTGFSALHAVVLILCIAACGSAVIICCLIYCRSDKEEFVANHSWWSFYPLGESVDLPCFIDPSLLTDSLKVEWRRSDSQTLVHLYQDREEKDLKSDVQHQDYHDRAHFFTEDIKHGNFSLKLKNLREEDKGIYTCTVYSGQRSVFYISTKLVLGFFIVNQRSFVPLGDSVVLPCSIDKELIKKKLKVEWRRSDPDTLVHLYEDGDIKPKAQHQDYHKRAHFSKEKIKNGDFSLQLKKVRAEDKGEYTCKVHTEDDSTISFNSTLKLGFRVDDTVVSLGGSVLLPCSTNLRFITKMEWKRSDSETLVHLYQDGDIKPDVQHQDYHDRAHFLTENIKNGNFSLRLDRIRTQDEGKYKCEVYTGQRSVFSGSTSLTLKLLRKLYIHVFFLMCVL